MKDVILPLLVILVIVGAVLIFGGTSKKPSLPSSNPQTNLTTPAYFDENAKVMFFYSDYCGWCQKEKLVLEELAQDGYKVKPMDVGKNEDFWQKYNIEGTPTFVAPDGQRLVGYTEKEELKKFLDRYK